MSLYDLYFKDQASFLWICGKLENKDQFHLCAANENFYLLLKPLFEALTERHKCNIKHEQVRPFPFIVRNLNDLPHLFDRLQQHSVWCLKLKIAKYWVDHNNHKLRNEYNPKIIEYNEAERRCKALITVENIVSKYNANSREQALRFAAADFKTPISKEDFEILCKYTHNLNGQSSNGNTALIWALKAKNIGFAEILIKLRANCTIANRDKETALHYAALLDSSKMLKLLLDDYKTNKNSQDLFGNTPLDWAIKANKTDCIEFLK